MGLFGKLGLDEAKVFIDWEMTPADTYGLFECRGDMGKVRSKNERYYYFYIDNWQKPARLCFMERGIRYARVLAHVSVPPGLIDKCIADQGKTYKENSYAINGTLQQWLKENVINTDDDSNVVPVVANQETEKLDDDLPARDDHTPDLVGRRLRSKGEIISEEMIAGLIRKHNFFESMHNPGGLFQNYFVWSNDNLAVTDRVTGITWQRNGCGHTSIRKLRPWIEDLNRAMFGGYDDWRLPTIDEVLSLLEPVKNSKGFYLHHCFSFTQAYIFTADRRKPGGYWFVDFGQARVYWAAGTCFSGGFGRLCRSGR